MKNFIGMLELNLFEVLGDPLFPKRYCSQVILPLLRMVESEERLRLTFTATGSAVEYLAHHFPLVLDQIRALIEEGRIELLCSAYTNADWQIFPGSDLRRSHRLTNEILRHNRLPLRRTMVAQHNTYWPAMRGFSEDFDVFLVRDTFLRGRRATRGFPAMARVGNSLLIVAANNLLHDMAARFVSQKETDTIGLFVEERLRTAVETWGQSDPRFIDVTIGKDDWHWFHSAGAHHLTTAAGLRNWETFYCDHDWMRIVQQFFATKMEEGVAFRLVSDFTCAARSQLEMLQDLGDDRSGHNDSSDHAYWLSAPEQRLRAALSWTSLSWRSRIALRKAESLAELAGELPSSETLRQKIDGLWRRLLWTEVSPAPNRAILPSEVEFIRDQGEEAISAATELFFALGASLSQPSITLWDDGIGPLRAAPGIAETELINGDGTVRWFSDGNGIHRCEVRFVSEEPTCGIGFKLNSTHLAFSACGDDCELATAPVFCFDDPGGIVVSVAGVYSLGEGLYLIRHNGALTVGAQVSESYLRFLVDFAPEGRYFEWPFTIVEGDPSAAVEVATRINAI